MRPLLLIGAVALAASGCAAPGLTRIGHDFARTMPEAEIGSGRAYGFGPVLLGFARLFVDDDEADTVLGSVRRVRFATYPVHGHVDAATVQTPLALQRLIDRGEWSLLVTSRDDGEATWVLYRARGTRITDVMTASMDSEELTLTHVTGRLDSVIRQALVEHGGFTLDAEDSDGW